MSEWVKIRKSSREYFSSASSHWRASGRDGSRGPLHLRASPAQVLCFAHVTNTMGQTELDFEKGEADGTADALRVLEAIVAACDPA
jgi:hypothetical protein